MNLDIDKLTEPELVDLNHRVVARLRFLRQMQAHADMLEFRVGQRVEFDAKSRGGEVKIGVLTKYNRKTVTVITDDGEHWNVAPSYLRPASDGGAVFDVEPKRISRDE